MRGWLQCRADIPAMNGAFKDHPAHQGVRRNNAPTVIAGCLPLVRAETGDKVIEVIPGGAEHVQQLLTETLSERDRSLRPRRRPLLPFLLRKEAAGLRATCRGRGIPPQSPRNRVRVVVRREDEMCHDIADVPAGTGTGLGPRILWQGG